MKTIIVAVGKLKERFWVDACQEYLKRIQPYLPTSVVEVPDSDPKRESQAIARILDGLSADCYLFALAIEGKRYSSPYLAEHIEKLMLQGTREVAFIIGASDGLDAEILKRADTLLSFGDITLPHNLARVVLLEQLYRAQKIIHGEPYHK